jgi:two-component system, NtrC family, sensor kinase
MKHLIFTLLFIPIILVAQEPKPGNLSAMLGKGPTNLAKEWKYKVGDNPEWANPDFDDSSWQMFTDVNLYNKEIQKKVKKTNIIWFRKRVFIDSITTQKLVANIFQSGASEIYLDGELIHSLGKVSSHPDSIVRFNPAYIPLSFPIKINKEQVLAVRFADAKKKFPLFQENTGFLRIRVQKEEFVKELRGNELSRGFVRLLSDWKIKLGDNPGWASPDVNDSLWQTVYDPTEFLKELSKKEKTPSIVWLRKKFRTDSTINQNVIAQVSQSGASEIYLDGKLIHKMGKIHYNPDSVVPYVVPSYSAIKNLSFPLQKKQDYTLAIRFVDLKERFPVFSKSNNVFFIMRVSTLEVATDDGNVRESWKVFNSFYVVLGTTLFMFILFLAFFLYFPAQKVNLYFSLSSLFFALYIIQTIRQEYVYLFKIHDLLLFYLPVTGYLVLIYLSFYKAFGQKLQMLFWVIISVGIFISPLNLLFDIKIDHIALFAILVLSDIARICFQALKQKNRAALVLLILIVVNALFLVVRIFNDLSIIIVPNISLYYPYSLLIMPVGLAFYLGFSFGQTNLTLLKNLKEIKELSYEKQQILTNQNIHLEKLVNERTSDLKESLESLKATQTQLIHSEKMASLGALTAGIAHEIQNPLNFVNNFSEISNELIDEMKGEMAAGNWQLATEISEEVKQNLEKINHHGKHADAIVKGMLQHSRTNTGQKEPTNINALADEYLRLAYHGMRAKDKSFHAEFKTDFDPDLPKITVVAQDIGRVLLNLINNAFYAVDQRSRHLSGIDSETWKPTVTVSTKNHGSRIEISVRDNGDGIPEEIKNKIFQPFFTTKPTGQGTGLGLSLAYDIVKAHGGEIKVATKPACAATDGESKGALFSIELPIN